MNHTLQIGIENYHFTCAVQTAVSHKLPHFALAVNLNKNRLKPDSTTPFGDRLNIITKFTQKNISKTNNCSLQTFRNIQSNCKYTTISPRVNSTNEWMGQSLHYFSKNSLPFHAGENHHMRQNKNIFVIVHITGRECTRYSFRYYDSFIQNPINTNGMEWIVMRCSYMQFGEPAYIMSSRIINKVTFRFAFVSFRDENLQYNPIECQK